MNIIQMIYIVGWLLKILFNNKKGLIATKIKL